MATFHFRQQVISSGHGRSAVRCAAYRHAAVMLDETTGLKSNYAHKDEVAHSEFALPKGPPRWAEQLGESTGRHDRTVIAEWDDANGVGFTGKRAIAASEKFWNETKKFEKRDDAQLAHEVVIALPIELSTERNVELMRAFVEEHYTSKGKVADWVYHDLPGNPHVHLMSSLRPLTDDGFGPKRTPRLDADGRPVVTRGGQKVYDHWAGGREHLKELRVGWEIAANLMLASEGLDVRIDHRSHQARGIQTIPTIHRGNVVHAMQNSGKDTDHESDDERERAEQFRRWQYDPQLVVDHISKEKSTFDDGDLASLIWRFAPNAADAKLLHMHVGALDTLIPVSTPFTDPLTGKETGEVRYSTLEVMEREEAMMASVNTLTADGSFAVDGLDEQGSAASLIVERIEDEQGFALTDEQALAVKHAVGSNGVGAIAGYAGAGKSTAMKVIRELYEDPAVGGGRMVVGGALAGKAAQGLTESSGIQAATLASWEKRWDMAEEARREAAEMGVEVAPASQSSVLPKGTVFVLDEAGMVASEQMGRVVKRLDEMGAKLLLVGDARQLQPIEAGAAFRSIANHVGYVELTQIRRQRTDWMATASIKFGSGDAVSALADYTERGHVAFVGKTDDARLQVLDNWMNDYLVGRETIMLAHANRDVVVLNEGARIVLKGHGRLTDDATVQTTKGERRFAASDRLVFLRNDRSLGVQNGRLGTVERVEIPGDDVDVLDVSERAPVLHVRLDGDDAAEADGEPRTVAIDTAEYVDLDHGYATTIHKSQGATVDTAHVLASGGMDSQLAYVAMTRHREDVSLTVPLEAFQTMYQRAKRELPSEAAALSSISTERLKDTTADYADTVDYAYALKDLARARNERDGLERRVDAFREMRGFPLVSEIRGAFSEKVTDLRGRLTRVAHRFDRAVSGVRQTAVERPITIAKDLVQRTGDTTVGRLQTGATDRLARLARQRSATFPTFGPNIEGALGRLSAAWDRIDAYSGPQRPQTREALYNRRFEVAAVRELVQSTGAREVAMFNRAIGRVIAPEHIVQAGPSADASAAMLAKRYGRLNGAYKERVLNLWPLIHAGQAAAEHLRETRDFRIGSPELAEAIGQSQTPSGRERAESVAVDVGTSGESIAPVQVHAPDLPANLVARGVVEDEFGHATHERVPAERTVMFPAITNWADTPEVAAGKLVGALARKEGWLAGPLSAASGAWRDAAPIRARLEFAIEKGSPIVLQELANSVRNDPASLGELRGRTVLGRPNAERKAAIERAAKFAHALTAIAAPMKETLETTQRYIVDQRAAFGAPLYELSAEARVALGRIDDMRRSPYTATAALAKELRAGSIKPSVASELRLFGQGLAARFPDAKRADTLREMQIASGALGTNVDARSFSSLLDRAREADRSLGRAETRQQNRRQRLSVAQSNKKGISP